MNLNDIVSNNRIINNHQAVVSNQNQQVIVTDAQINPREAALNQIMSRLQPGDNLSAQIVGKDGNVVTLQLPGSAPFEAKLSADARLEIGQLISFEVKSNASKLMLSPLFTNMATDPSINKALNNAGIPVNSDTYAMTKALMQGGMPIDRNSLSEVYKEVINFPDTTIENIVDLHKLGLKVDETNLSQIDNYKNLSYQLSSGLQDTLSDLNNTLNDLVSGDNLESASKLFSDMVSIITDGSDMPLVEFFDEPVLSENDNNLNSSMIPGQNVRLEEQSILHDEGLNSSQQIDDNNVKTGENKLSAADRALMLLRGLNEQDSPNITGKSLIDGLNEKNNIDSHEVNAVNIKDDILSNPENVNKTNKSPEQIRESLVNELKNYVKDPDLSQRPLNELFSITKALVTDAASKHDFSKLKALLGNDSVKQALISQISDKWSISPAEVSDKESVKDLYNNLTKQLNMLEKTLESIGQKDSPSAASVNNMSSNIDFLNQVNQMYAYVQLPLKLSGGDKAHGDLYVYTNGKKLSKNDGTVSALLHLDMKNLGPLDIYVAMDKNSIQNKVSTQFYVADDSILDFLNDHMDELNKRLEAKGIKMSAKLSIKGEKKDDSLLGEGAEGGGINGVLSQTQKVKASEYSFDVRT